MSKTHTNHFTDEQMDHLRVNHYVKSITATTIRFTEEFKRYFLQKRNEGVSSHQIFMECGLEPDILGESRISGFRYTIKKYAMREEGFIDNRQYGHRKEKSTDDMSVETRIKHLEHELAYTRQEVEFLKKLQTADMEARRQWESKHLPK